MEPYWVPRRLFSTISISVKALILQKESRTWTKPSQDTSSDSSSLGCWSRLWSSPEIRALSLKPCCLYLFKMHGLILSSVNTCIFPGVLLYTFSGGKSVSSHIGLKWEESSSSLHISLDCFRVWGHQHLPVSYCYKEAPCKRYLSDCCHVFIDSRHLALANQTTTGLMRTQTRSLPSAHRINTVFLWPNY